MTVAGLGLSAELVQLGFALGVFRLQQPEDLDSWTLNPDFFSDPPAALAGVAADPARLRAAITLATSLLGQVAETIDLPDLPPGQTWIPLVRAGATGGSLFAVLNASETANELGIAGSVVLGSSDTRFTATAEVPVVRVERDGTATLLLGTAGGVIRAGVGLILPPAASASDVTLAEVALIATLPTSAGHPPSIGVRIRGLKLPSWDLPRDLDLGSNLASAGTELVAVLLSLLEARAGLAPTAAVKLRALLTLLGLGDTTTLPPLLSQDLVTRGLAALGDWLQSVFTPQPGEPLPSPRAQAWLTALADLLGLTGPPRVEGTGTGADPYRICATPAPGVRVCVRLVTGQAAGTASLRLGLTAEADIGGPPPALAGALRAEADLLAGVLGASPQVTWLPDVRVEARFGTSAAPLVRQPAAPTPPAFQVAVLRVGLAAGPDHRVALLLAAEDVVLSGQTYPRLDLSSVEALTASASTVGTDALTHALTGFLDDDGTDRRTRALLALLGLRAPVSAWPVALPTAPEVVTDPVGAWTRYHARGLATGNWGALADELAVLFRTTSPTGSGTAADPWAFALPMIPLDAGELAANSVQTELLLWSTGPGTAPVLHVAARIVPSALPLDSATLRLTATIELVRATLPDTPPSRPELSFLDGVSLAARLGDNLVLDGAPVLVTLGTVATSLTWERGAAWAGSAVVTGAKVTVSGTALALPDPFELAPGRLPALPSIGSDTWRALAFLLGQSFAVRFDPTLPGLSPRILFAGLLGWLGSLGPLQLRIHGDPGGSIDLPDLLSAGWPALSLPDLISNPVAAVRAWLVGLLTAPGGLDLSLPAVGLVNALLGGDLLDTVDVRVRGNGTHAEPWRLPLTPEEGTPELLAWLDPEGPTLAGLGDALAQLVPDDLTEALDGRAPLPDADRLVEVLSAAARLDSDLSALLVGRDELAPALQALTAALGGTDGLVPATAQSAPGDTSSQVVLDGITHLDAPGAFALADHLPGADPARVVYVSTDLSGAAPWRNQPTAPDPRLVDLRLPGLPPEAFAIDRISATGPWYVLLPTRAAAATASLGGLEGVTARLRHALQAIAMSAGGSTPLIVVAHSIAGHAARTVWAEGSIQRLITLATLAPGAPPGTSGLNALAQADLVDAVRMIQRLVALAPAPASSSADLRRLTALLATLAPALEDARTGAEGLRTRAPFPRGDFVAPPLPASPSGALPPIAVTVRLTEETLGRAIASLIRANAQRVLDRLQDASGLPARAPVTRLGLGFGTTLPAPGVPAGPPGGVQTRVALRLDTHQIRLTGSDAPRPVPRLEVTMSLRREGGWLVGGPGRPNPSGGLAARVRWAELKFTAGPGPSDSAATVVLHDAGLHGIDLGRSRITGSTLDTTARLLLGELARALSPVPDTGPLRELLDLFASLGFASLDAAGTLRFEPDALERLLVDPSGYLRTALADSAVADAALRRLFGMAPTGPAHNPLGASLRLELDTAARTVTLATTGTGLRLGDVALLKGRLTLTASGQVATELRVRGPDAPGPLDDTWLILKAQPAETPPLTLWLSEQEDLGTGAIQLHPSPDTTALGKRLMAVIGGELVQLGIGWARDLGARIDPLLGTLGLLEPGDPPRARNLRRLLEAPERWLMDPAVLGVTGKAGQLAPGKVARFVEALGALLGVPGATGQLWLPAGGTLEVAEAAGDLLVALTFREQAIDASGGKVGATAKLVLRVAPGPAVTASLSASVRRTGTTGLAAAALELEAGDTLRITARLTPLGTGASELVLPLLPTSFGLGELAGWAGTATVEHALPALLDALANLGGTVDARRQAISAALGELGTALHLRDANSFLIAELRLLVQDPPGELASRFRANPAATAKALRDLVQALAGNASAGPSLWRSAGGRIGVDLDALPNGEPRVTVTARGLSPITGAAADVRVALSVLGLGSSSLAVRVTDPDVLLPGPVDLRPFVEVHLGTVFPEGPDRFELGLWLDPEGVTEREALVLRVPFASPAAVLHRRTRAAGPSDSADLAAAIPKILQRILAPLAAEIALGLKPVQDLLEKKVRASQQSIGEVLTLSGVLTGTGPRWQLDGKLFEDLIPRALRAAVSFLPTTGSALGPFKLKLLSQAHTAGATRYGIGIELDKAMPLALPPIGGVVLSVVADASWEPKAPQPAAGDEVLRLWVVALPETLTSPAAIAFIPEVQLRGLGVHAEGERGPLLDLGVSIRAVDLNASFQYGPSGLIHAGARLLVQDLGMSLGSAGGGTNPVAAKILSPGPGAGDQTPPAPRFRPELVVWMKEGAAQPTISLRAGTGPTPWWIAIQRSFGPLYIEQVGIDIQQAGETITQLGVLVDGGVSLAGLSIAVDDLSLTLPWATAGNPSTWRLGLAGLAVVFDSESVSIAGGLRRFERPNVGTEYSGMLRIRAAQFGLTAVGSYGEFLIPGSTERYTSMFVFAALAATIGGPPCFFITGVGGGIGLNRALVVPQDMTKITSFPLVGAMDPNSALLKDPMGAIGTLGTTFPPQRGAFWLAAGIRFTTFTVVESIAVLTVAIGDDVEVALLGLCRMGLPNPSVPIVQIELAMRAHFSSREAALLVQAQLTDNSWLLNPSCRLTGGFALACWFRTGEFVLTLGGYHRQFKRPAHFPDVPRLGIHWSVSNVLSIKGESYFALTGSCVMAGARIEAAFDAGMVKASFTAGIDALVSWDPFFYTAGTYVTISASLTLEFEFFGKHRCTQGFSIGAEVNVWGPPLRGLAVVDLGVSRFPVAFGPEVPAEPEPPLGWSAFHDKYLVAGDSNGETMSLAVSAGQLVPDPGSGTRPPDDGGAERPFQLLPDFELTSTTRTASTRVGTQTLNGPPLALAPMCIANVISTHDLQVFPAGSGIPVSVPNLTWTPVRGGVPEGVWKMLDDATTGEGTVRQAFTGAVLRATSAMEGGQAQGTITATETGTAGLPLRDPDEAFALAMAEADTWSAQQAQVDALQRAAELWRGVGTAALNRCLGRTPPAGPSAFARSLLQADLVAPPRLARITRGMFVKPQPPVAVQEHPHLEPPEPEAPRVAPPHLLAVMCPPAARRPGNLRTTVSDQPQRPRRVPPTLVQARAAALPTAANLHLAAPLVSTDPAPFAPFTPVARSQDRGRRFVRAGGALEARRDFLATERAQQGVRDMERLLARGGAVPLAAGQVQVWRFQGAAEDYRQDRPRLRISGTQAVRLVALDCAGNTLIDRLVVEQVVEIPIGTQYLATLGTGGPLLPGRGIAGWHVGSTVAQVTARTALVPGGILRVTSSGTLRARRLVAAALQGASAFVQGSGLIETDLPANTRCIVIAVSARTAIDPAKGGLLLGLDHAKRASDLAGAPLPPIVVTAGTRAFLLFEVRPGGKTPVKVTIGHRPEWALAGVLGSERLPPVIARALLDEGIEGVSGRLVEASAAPVSFLTWFEGS